MDGTPFAADPPGSWRGKREMPRHISVDSNSMASDRDTCGDCCNQ